MSVLDRQTYLVTGGAGFIGSNFCRYLLQTHPEARVVVLDALTYAGNLSTVADLETDPGRFRFYPGNIQDETVVNGLLEAEDVSFVVNFAAETHNDRSILDPGSFIQTDVYGVFVLLDAVRRHGVQRLLHVSTDEVYGTIAEGQFTERHPLEPNTPYAASKAGGELQVRAHVVTYGVPAVVTRCGNNFGPYQYPEKLIPFFVTRLLDHKRVPLYGSGDQIRDWIYVMDHCAGIDFALRHGEQGLVYNIGANCERTNLEITQMLLKLLGRSESLVKQIADPRGAAHDTRYSLDTTRLRSLGWQPSFGFDRALESTVRWYVDHPAWWRAVTAKSGYQEFVRRFYGPSLGDDL